MLGVVGAVAVATGVVTETVWFWIIYGLVWLTFFELFEEKSAFWETIYGDRNVESTEQASSVEETVDPVTVLKQRYAEGAIDDESSRRDLTGYWSPRTPSPNYRPNEKRDSESGRARLPAAFRRVSRAIQRILTQQSRLRSTVRRIRLPST